MKNPEILAEDMVRYIYQGETGFNFLIKNAAFVLSEKFRNLGLGSRSFAIEALAALEADVFDKIVTSAIGSYHTLISPDLRNQYSGYYAWARLGFDAALPAEVHAQCTGKLAGLTRVHELMKSDAGREIWLKFGMSTDMEFDLAESSACWTALRSYMIEN